MIALALSVAAQGDEQLDSLVNSLSGDKYGIAVLVARGDSILYQHSVGYADLELKVPLNPDHIFRIGSITKQFTAVAILKLQREGKLDIEEKLDQYLPDYPNAKNISMKHLLNHTSGIKNYTELKKWTPEEQKRDFSTDELISYFKDEKPDFQPGESWRYNDSGYVLLGKVIEIISGLSFKTYIEKEILVRYGLTKTRYGSTSKIILDRSKGYKEENGRPMNAGFLSMSQPYAAGGLLSTVVDLWRWNRMVFSGEILSNEILLQAHTETVVGDKSYPYGYGWQIDYPGKSKALYHHGWINGFFTTAWYIPSERLFVTVLSNCTCKDPRSLAKELIMKFIN